MIRVVRDAKLACPMCGHALKTDEVMLWCENAKCDFHRLFGELVYDKPKKSGKKSRAQVMRESMGKGFVEHRVSVAQQAEQRFCKPPVAGSIPAAGPSQEKLAL